MPLPATLEPGPLYFFDQLKTRRRERGKKIREALLTDFNSLNTNSHSEGFITSLVKCRNPGCAGEHVERNEDGFLIDDTARREKSLFLPQKSSSSLFSTSSEVPSSKLSQVPSGEEEILLSQLDNCKNIAPIILQELDKILHLFARYDIIFPQGIVNLLNYSWKELVEGADYSKMHKQESLRCKNMRSGEGQASEECHKMAPGSEHMGHEMTDFAKGRHKKNVLPASALKEKRNPEMTPNKPLGNKALVTQHNTHLPVTISFSLSSKLYEERGWSFQHSEAEDVEWKVPFSRAAERLRQALIQINDQILKQKEAGFDQPVILRHYGDALRESFPKKFKGQTSKTYLSELLNGKPQIPAIKQADPALRKLHYGLIDGSSLIYYPCGHIAVCQSYSDLPGGGVYTNIFDANSDQTILGTFTPFGHGCICLHNSNTIAMMFNQEGGKMTNKDGEIVREWRWPQVGKLSDPIVMQVNDYITVKIAGRFAISLVYKWQHESVRLSLSPLQGVAFPQLEELGHILTRVKLSSESAKEFFKVNRKKLSEKETKKVLKKEPRLSEFARTPEIPRGNMSHVNDISASRELRTLQRKIKNILEDWLEHYRMVLGVDLPHIHKKPGLPRRAVRKHTIQSADAPLVASVVQSVQEKKREDSGAYESDGLLLARFQSAPAHNRQRKQSSYSVRMSCLLKSSINSDQLNVTQFNLNKYSPVLQSSYVSRDKLRCTSHSACPIVLRRILMGQEGKICRCSNHQIPYVSDLEYDHLINNQMSALEQIMVVCVSSSLKTNEATSEDKLEQLYERKNRNRSMPCIQGRLDSFRLLRYDITSADEFTGHKGSVLVQRHNVAPGTFLMYIQGKLLFANYIFNGYSKSAKDLQKQIARTRSDFHMGYCLHSDFKFWRQNIQRFHPIHPV